MQLLKEDKRKRSVKEKDEIEFSGFSSFYLITVTARAKGEKQISPKATDDEDLTLKIDNEKTFPKLSGGLIDSPASFSGGTLHNFAKTVYFITFLKGKEHKIELLADEPPGTAAFESAQVYALSLGDKLSLEIENQAEDGDRRPWITIVLENLPLRSFTPTVSYSRRKRDSDDVKVIVDDRVQGNLLRNIKHFLWRYVGSRLPGFSSKTDTETFPVNLKKGLHYIEFWADRMPTLQNLTLDFGIKPQLPKDIPTADEPKWTGDFYDDTADMLLARLILGEAGGEPEETKVWIAGSVINRVRSPAWPNTVHEVILQSGQYDPFKSEDPNYSKIIDPLRDASKSRKSAWTESYEVARKLLSGEVQNPTEATHFHGRGVSKEWFLENIVPRGKFIKQIGDTYFYWSPN